MDHGQQGHNRTVGIPDFRACLEVRCGVGTQQIGEFAVPEANQGVGVDAKHFYAVDTTICQGATPDLRYRT